jgi:hypothetical protein
VPDVPRLRAERDDAHDVVYFRRHVDDDPGQSTPARAFLASCPITVRAKFAAILVAVASAPPHRFAGGGYWEAMHADMAGWYEVRVDGPKPRGGRGRHHYRLYCLLDYRATAALGAEYLARNPRSVV